MQATRFSSLAAGARDTLPMLVGAAPFGMIFGTLAGASPLAAWQGQLMSLGVFGEVGLAPVSAALFVLMSAMGVTLPNTQALALMRVRHAAGSASALLGTSSFLIGAIASPLVGVAGEDTAVPMAVVQLSATLVAAVCFVALCRPWNRRTAVGTSTGTTSTTVEGAES